MQFSMPLKQNHLFRRLYARGQSAANRHLVLYCRKNRQLREIYRLHEAQFRPGYDLVVVVRTRGMQASFQELTQAYLSLARKLELLLPEARP